jgi:hypothetical protein
MPLGAFQPPKPAPGEPATVFPWSREQELLRLVMSGGSIYILGSHTGTLPLRTINPEFKDLARTWGDVPLNMQILFSGFVGSKAPNSMGKISTLGVLRLRAQALCSRDKSVRRSAQDDDFVGVLKITSKAS